MSDLLKTVWLYVALTGLAGVLVSVAHMAGVGDIMPIVGGILVVVGVVGWLAGG